MPPPPLPAHKDNPATRSSSATASFVLGLLGFLTCGLTAIPAVICGLVAMRRFSAAPIVKGKGLATLGLVFGVLQLLLLGGSVLALRDLGVQLEILHALRRRTDPPTPTVAASDTEKAPFVLILPEGADPQTPIPCVFWIHGYASAGNDVFEGSEAFYQDIANRQGMAFIGITAGRRASSGEDAGGPVWAESVTEDQRQLESMLKLHSPQLRPEWGKCVLFGFSQGGKVAGLLLAGHPDKYQGALIFSPGTAGGAVSIVPNKTRLEGLKAICFSMEEAFVTVKLTEYYDQSLRKAGAQTRLVTYPGVRAHQLPPDFTDRFEDWLMEVRGNNGEGHEAGR